MDAGPLWSACCLTFHVAVSRNHSSPARPVGAIYHDGHAWRLVIVCVRVCVRARGVGVLSKPQAASGQARTRGESTWCVAIATEDGNWARDADVCPLLSSELRISVFSKDSLYDYPKRGKAAAVRERWDSGKPARREEKTVNVESLDVGNHGEGPFAEDKRTPSRRGQAAG
ncbi:hypothetical protein B0H63DRAFT_82264 [Podospora didyma]|uniref:Uncharacterized protein n=1 Tax=Podospora didyma TaxID=330526 RepID=A0AAE0JZY5_9PEZI|nr:hypothetical protein B0H63DRAFT_82264 [Podospora didyma]